MIIHSPVKIWRKQKEVTSLLGKQGKVISYSLIHVPPLGFANHAPYIIAVVELDNGKSRVGQLVDYKKADLKMGAKVEAVLRRVREPDLEGIIPYGIKFKLIGKS